MKEILIDKSIQKQRLVFELNGQLIFDYIMAYFLTFMLPAITIKLVVFPSKYNLQHPSPVFDMIFIIIDIWLIISFYLMNKLVTVNGQTFDDNKEHISKILQNEYPNFEFIQSEDQRLILFGRKVEDWNRGKLITVILSENKIYLNILSTYRGGASSAFNGLGNYLKCRSIAKSLKLSLIYKTW